MRVLVQVGPRYVGVLYISVRVDRRRQNRWNMMVLLILANRFVLFTIFTASLPHHSLPVCGSEIGVLGVVEHSRRGRRVQDSTMMHEYCRFP